MVTLDIRDLGPIGQLLSGIGTATVAWIAVLARASYARQINLEQMKWLQQLYESFYGSSHYKSVRQLIDFDDLQGMRELLRQEEINPGQLNVAQRTQLDEFTDYLNFFEWVGFLEGEGQLTFKQVDAMFKYYLVRLLQVDKDQQIRKFLRQSGYEQLDRMLERYSRTGN